MLRERTAEDKQLTDLHVRLSKELLIETLCLETWCNRIDFKVRGI